MKRQAAKLGYSFVGFPNGARGFNSTLSLECKRHGVWSTGRVANFLKGHACPKCAIEKNADLSGIPDSVYIEKAMSGELYKAGTVLVPSDFNNGKWKLVCQVCANDDISLS
ncbi:hypothetical protein D3C86_1755760 [compost metagenome]